MNQMFDAQFGHFAYSNASDNEANGEQAVDEENAGPSHGAEPTAASKPDPAYEAGGAPSSSTKQAQRDLARDIDLGVQFSIEHPAIISIQQLLGAVSLPMKVTVDIRFVSLSDDIETVRQVVWLRLKNSKTAVLCIPEPLLFRVTSFSHASRELSLDVMGDIPCLVLQLTAPTMKSGGPSVYIGVQFHGGKWQVRIKGNNTKYTTNLGCFVSEVEAARVYDSASRYLRGSFARLNFPNEEPGPLDDELKIKVDGLGNEDFDADTLGNAPDESIGGESQMSARGSLHRGVMMNKQGKKWEARMNVPGRNLYLGCCNTEIEAARIYDTVCHYLRGERWRAKLNFPDEEPQPLTDEMKAKLKEMMSSPVTHKVTHLIPGSKTKRAKGGLNAPLKSQTVPPPTNVAPPLQFSAEPAIGVPAIGIPVYPPPYHQAPPPSAYSMHHPSSNMTSFHPSSHLADPFGSHYPAAPSGPSYHFGVDSGPAYYGAGRSYMPPMGHPPNPGSYMHDQEVPHNYYQRPPPPQHHPYPPHPYPLYPEQSYPHSSGMSVNPSGANIISTGPASSLNPQPVYPHPYSSMPSIDDEQMMKRQRIRSEVDAASYVTNHSFPPSQPAAMAQPSLSMPTQPIVQAEPAAGHPVYAQLSGFPPYPSQPAPLYNSSSHPQGYPVPHSHNMGMQMRDMHPYHSGAPQVPPHQGHSGFNPIHQGHSGFNPGHLQFLTQGPVTATNLLSTNEMPAFCYSTEDPLKQAQRLMEGEGHRQ